MLESHSLQFKILRLRFRVLGSTGASDPNMHDSNIHISVRDLKLERVAL